MRLGSCVNVDFLTFSAHILYTVLRFNISTLCYRTFHIYLQYCIGIVRTCANSSWLVTSWSATRPPGLRLSGGVLRDWNSGLLRNWNGSLVRVKNSNTRTRRGWKRGLRLVHIIIIIVIYIQLLMYFFLSYTLILSLTQV